MSWYSLTTAPWQGFGVQKQRSPESGLRLRMAVSITGSLCSSLSFRYVRYISMTCSRVPCVPMTYGLPNGDPLPMYVAFSFSWAEAVYLLSSFMASPSELKGRLPTSHFIPPKKTIFLQPDCPLTDIPAFRQRQLIPSSGGIPGRCCVRVPGRLLPC